MSEPTVFLIRPHRGGWQCCEAEGVQPYFTDQDPKQSAIDYATGRLAHRQGEIRVVDQDGIVIETIAFDERRK